LEETQFCSLINIEMLFKALILLCFIVSALAGANCKDSTSDIGDCKIKQHVCEDYYSLDWRYQYKCTSTDKESGDSKSSDWHTSADSACRHSTVSLFEKLGDHSSKDYDCNCDKKDIQSGPCNLRIVACFYFKSTSDLEDKKATYEATAYDMNNTKNTGYADGFKKAEDAGQAAADDLFKHHSDTAKACGQSVAAFYSQGELAQNITMQSSVPGVHTGFDVRQTYRVAGVGEDDKCNGPHESCCEAPMKDPNNCPDSARTHDCDAKGACCCA
jgi:hypothetical protein